MNRTEDGAKYEWSTTQHALACLNVADSIPHRKRGEAVLLEHVAKDRDGRLIKLNKVDRPELEALSVDASTMLKSEREHFLMILWLR